MPSKPIPASNSKRWIRKAGTNEALGKGGQKGGGTAFLEPHSPFIYEVWINASWKGIDPL